MAWYWIVLICLAGVALLYLLICWVLSIAMIKLMMFPAGGAKLSYEQVRQEQTALGGVDYNAYDRMPKEPFALQSEGAEIHGELIPAIVPSKAGERPKCVIRVHGHTQNKMLSVRYIPMFQALGYAAVLYDQRAFGQSTGAMCTFGYKEKHDLSAVISWVKQRMGENTLIGVHGESLGAITGLETLGVDDRIDFLVADSGCSDMPRATAYHLNYRTHLPAFPLVQLAEHRVRRLYGMGFKDIRPIGCVEKSRVPILFLHGTEDEQIPVWMCEELYTAAQNPLSRMALFEGARHCQGHVREPERYEEIVQGFVREVEAICSRPPLAGKI